MTSGHGLSPTFGSVIGSLGDLTLEVYAGRIILMAHFWDCSGSNQQPYPMPMNWIM